MDSTISLQMVPWRRLLLEILDLPADADIEYCEVHGQVLGLAVRWTPRPSACPKCDGHHWSPGRTARQDMRVVPIGAFQVQVLVTTKVWHCACGHRYQPVLSDGYSRGLLEQMATDAVTHSLSDVARSYGIDRTAIKPLLKPILEWRVAQRPLHPARLIGLDVTRKGKKDIVSIVDLERSVHLELMEYDARKLESYLKTLGEHWPAPPEAVVIDLDTKLKKIVSAALPNSTLLVDRYHVQQQVNSAVTRFVKAYKGEHPLPALFVLRHPEHANYQEVAATLRYSGHGILVDVHEYARQVAQIFQAFDSATARELWYAWRAALPQPLKPYLHPTIKNINDNWLDALCATADYKTTRKKPTPQSDAVVNVSNGVVESLHNRIKQVTIQSPTLEFEFIRLRLLLWPSRVTKDGVAQALRTDLRNMKRALRDANEEDKVKRPKRNAKSTPSPRDDAGDDHSHLHLPET